jgi:Leucine-rich repeat (LRR) protein
MTTFLNDVIEASNKSLIIDVSHIYNNGGNTRLLDLNSLSNNLKGVYGLPIVSNTHLSYDRAVKLLPSKYHGYSQSFLNTHGKLQQNNIPFEIKLKIASNIPSKYLSTISSVDKAFQESVRIVRNNREITIGNNIGKYPLSLKKLTYIGSAKTFILMRNFSSLIKLNCSGVRLGNGGLFPLLELSNLKELDCRNCNLNTGGLEPLTKHKTLEVLDCGHNNLGVGGLDPLINLSNLRDLNCSFNSLGKRDFTIIGKLKSLKMLTCIKNNVEDDDLEVLITSFDRIIKLDLTNNYLTHKCVNFLTKIKSLKLLGLSNNIINKSNKNKFNCIVYI